MSRSPATNLHQADHSGELDTEAADRIGQENTHDRKFRRRTA